MKSRLLTLLLLVCSFSVFGQDVRGDRVIADKQLLPPYRDTNYVPNRKGELVTRPADGLTYRAIATTLGVKKWEVLGSGVGGTPWNLTGNPGTSPTANFFGASDSVKGILGKNGNHPFFYFQQRGWDAYPIVGTPADLYLGNRAGYRIIPKLIDGTSSGTLNIGIGGDALPFVGAAYDTAAENPSNQNVVIGVYGGHFIQKNSFVTHTGRNVLVGESSCFNCLTPGENTGVGVFTMTLGFRPTKNTAIGSNALRTANSSMGMTSLGAYASAYSSTIISSVTVNSSSSDWTTATVTFSPPYTTGDPGSCFQTATGHAVIVGNQITAIVIDNPGCGYIDITGTFYTGYTNYRPTVTVTGDGTSFSGTVNVRSATNGVAAGHTAGWFSRAPDGAVYIGYQSEPSTRYWDDMPGAIGPFSGIDGSVSPLTKLYKAWAIGPYAKVSTSKTMVFGGVYTDTNKVNMVVNNITYHAPTDAVSIYGGNLWQNDEATVDSISIWARNSYTGQFPDTTRPLTNAQTDMAIGIDAMKNWTSGNTLSTAVGYKTMEFTTSMAHTTALGSLAMRNAVSGGFGNTALGAEAFERPTSISQATAVGAFSGYKISGIGVNGFNQRGLTAIGFGTCSGTSFNGEWNTAVGVFAGSAWNGSSTNTAIGAFSMGAGGITSVLGGTPQMTGTQNTALGISTMFAPTTAFGNVAVGASAVRNVSSGSYNTGVGYVSLTNVTTGQQNTAVGDSAGVDISTGSFNTILGGDKGTDIATSDRNVLISDGEGNRRIKIPSSGEVQVINGNLNLQTAGNKIKIATGSDASVGTATLVGGTVTVSTTAVTTSSIIFVTVNTPGGTQGFISVPSASIVNGTSFVINSSNVLETSTVNWWIVN